MDSFKPPTTAELQQRLKEAAELYLVANGCSNFMLTLDGLDRKFVLAGGEASGLPGILQSVVAAAQGQQGDQGSS